MMHNAIAKMRLNPRRASGNALLPSGKCTFLRLSPPSLATEASNQSPNAELKRVTHGLGHTYVHKIRVNLAFHQGALEIIVLSNL